MAPPPAGVSFTVLVLGASGVGKTAFIKRFTHGYFVADHICTVEDVYTRPVTIGNRSYELQIWDTGAPQKELTGRLGLTDRLQLHLARADGVVLCYSVTDADSFRSALALFKQINQLRPDNVPVFFAGCKADSSLADHRQVRPLSNGRVAEQLGVADDMMAETCARQNRECSRVFFSLTRAILQAREEQRIVAKQLRRQASKGTKRSDSMPAVSESAVTPPATPLPHSHSFGEIEFDATSNVPPAAFSQYRPLSSASLQHTHSGTQPTVQRSRSLSRMTTSLRKQKETGPRAAGAVGGALRRSATQTDIASGSTEQEDIDDGRATLRSFGSCSNLAGIQVTAQRAASLRRQATQGSIKDTSGPSVRRSLSARNLSEMGIDTSSGSAAQLVHKALSGIEGIAADDLPPVSGNQLNRQLSKQHSRSKSSSSLIDHITTGPSAEAFGLKRSMELRSARTFQRQLTDEDGQASVTFQRSASAGDSLPEIIVARDLASTSSHGDSGDADSGVGSMSLSSAHSRSSPEPDTNSIRTTSSSDSNATSSGNASRSSSFRLSFKPWWREKKDDTPVAGQSRGQAVPAATP